jgi:hypothetical protein
VTIVFPKNNLPEPAQPWAREVQKQLANVIASDRSNEINNAARDNQLNSSLISLSKVANDASSAINGLLGLGSSGSGYSINADNINAGTITGINLVSSIGLRSISISDGLIYFSESGVLSGAISGFSNYVQIADASEQSVITVGGSTINLSTNLVYCDANLSVIGNINASGYTVTSSSVSTSSVSASSVNGGDGTFNTALRSSNIPSFGVGAAGFAVFATSAAGRLGFSTSSLKTKQEIELLDIDVSKILQVTPKSFKYNVDVAEYGLENAQTTVGFIAEDLNDLGLNYFVRYNDAGEPIAIPYEKYVVALQAVVRNLNDRITTLENGAN